MEKKLNYNDLARRQIESMAVGHLTHPFDHHQKELAVYNRRVFVEEMLQGTDGIPWLIALHEKKKQEVTVKYPEYKFRANRDEISPGGGDAQGSTLEVTVLVRVLEMEERFFDPPYYLVVLVEDYVSNSEEGGDPVRLDRMIVTLPCTSGAVMELGLMRWSLLPGPQEALPGPQEAHRLADVLDAARWRAALRALAIAAIRAAGTVCQVGGAKLGSAAIFSLVPGVPEVKDPFGYHQKELELRDRRERVRKPLSVETDVQEARPKGPEAVLADFLSGMGALPQDLSRATLPQLWALLQEDPSRNDVRDLLRQRATRTTQGGRVEVPVFVRANGAIDPELSQAFLASLQNKTFVPGKGYRFRGHPVLTLDEALKVREWAHPLTGKALHESGDGRLVDDNGMNWAPLFPAPLGNGRAAWLTLANLPQIRAEWGLDLIPNNMTPKQLLKELKQSEIGEDDDVYRLRLAWEDAEVNNPALTLEAKLRLEVGTGDFFYAR